MKLRTSVAALYGACLVLGFCPEDSVAATATDLVTICTSATTTIQASKCTAWQYNVYSPTAYIESYPTVTPAETGINDPNYEYRPGSTLTPTMGVKVCPTALTPGVSFNSPQADPCPNNKLVAASTVLPTNTYAVASSPAGFVVYQVNTAGVSQVSGSPFSIPDSTQYLVALDPTGEYLYSVFYSNEAGGTVILSYRMVSGVPQYLSSTGTYAPGRDAPDFGQVIATTHHLYASSNPAVYEFIPNISVWSTNNGVISSAPPFQATLPTNSPGFGYDPISFAVDPQEEFLYWYFSSTGGTVSDTVAIFNLNFTTSTATFVQAVTQSGQVLLGAQ